MERECLFTVLTILTPKNVHNCHLIRSNILNGLPGLPVS